MVDVNEGFAEALYDVFAVASETDGYALSVSGFHARNPHGLKDELSVSNGAKFSTADNVGIT